MNKISYKFGGLLFLIIFLLQAILSILLYFTVVNNRVEEEVEQLLIRGIVYSNLLSTQPDEETLNWIASLEEQQDTKIVVSDQTNLRVLGEKNVISQEMLNQIREGKNVITSKSMVMKRNWTSSDFLCTVSPIFQERQVIGYVYLFEGTEYLRGLVMKIGWLFLLMTGLSLIVTGLAVLYLTKRLTKPILDMKEKTSSLMKTEILEWNNVKKKDELGELEDLIEKLTEELHEMKHQRNDFLASIAHELRTPLTYIKGYINVLNKHEINEEKRTYYLNIVREETESLTLLVENLFLLAKLDKNEFIIEKVEVYLPTLILKTIEKIRAAHETSGKELILHNYTEIGNMKLDPIRIEQVISNLVNNAIRYTKENAIIDVFIREDKDNMLIEVKDNGTGIDICEQNKIFEPFYRIEKGRNRNYGGYGLGLTIVKEIVEKHDGRILVQSEKNIGTSITIVLPKE